MPIHDWSRLFPGVFHDFHNSWLSELRRVLNQGLLPKGYYALAEQRMGAYEPDILALEKIHTGTPAKTNPDESGGVALIEAPPKVAMTAETSDLSAYAAKRRSLAIRHVSDDRLVALIEIVSKGTKSSRSAMDEFVHKSTSALMHGLHLLVVDVHPPGTFDPHGIHGAIWSELDNQPYVAPPSKPLTLVSYASKGTVKAFIEPRAVGDALTDMPLFLEAERYVSVPLESSYNAALAGEPTHLREQLERK